MIRAIFFDIDGTLLDSATGKVPPSTLACLRALQRKGVRLWVATGRFPAMTTFLRDIFPFDGVITLNGQLATDKDGQVLHRMAHEPENIRALVELVRQDPEPFPCLIIEEEQCFSLRESPVIQEHFAWAGLPAPEAYHLSRLEEHPVLQFLAYIMSTEQTPVFFAAPKYPAMLSKLAKGRTESYGDSARGPTWQSHEQRFPAALQ